MNYALITGSAGLIGSESVKFFSQKGYKVIGIDNDLRKTFFGEEASTAWNLKELQRKVPNYDHFPVDIRDSSICLQLQLQGNLLPYVQGT